MFSLAFTTSETEIYVYTSTPEIAVLCTRCGMVSRQNESRSETFMLWHEQ